MSGRAWALFWLVALTGLLAPALALDLRLPDEPRVAQTSLAMLHSGDYVVPTVNGKPFLQTPPLHYWLLAAWQRLAGLAPDGLARVPSVVFSAGTLALTAAAGRRLAGERGGLLAALVLAGTIGFWDAGQRNVVDTSLAFFVALSIDASTRALCEGGRVWPPAVLAGAAAGAAFLVKGLPGPVIAACALLVPLAVDRSLRGRRAATCVLAAVPAFFLVALPWLILLHQRDPSYPRELLFSHLTARVLDAAHHDTPNLHFIHRALVKFLPWGALLPLAVAWAARSWRREARDGLPAAGARAVHLSWLIVPLILLLLSRSKRNLYLLPLYPAAALLVGSWLARLDLPRRAGAMVLPAAWIVAIVVPVAGGTYAAWLDRDPTLAPLGARLALLERNGSRVLGLGLEEREEAAVAWYLRHPFPNDDGAGIWTERIRALSPRDVVVGEAMDLERAFEAAGVPQASRVRLDGQSLRRRRLEVWRLTVRPAGD